MSLQVWLPLNGDLTNNGIANATISGSNIIYDTGLMGKAKTTGEVIIDKNYQGIVGSMAMWIYTSPNGDTTRIFGNDSSGTKNRKWTIHRYPTRNDLHSWGCCEDSNTTNPGSSGFFTITGALPDNKWTHIVYAHNATNGYIYVNGELRYTTSWNSTGKVYTFSDPVPLLSENGGNKICDFRLYNHCLSAKEVKDLAKGLVLHYRLAGPGQENLIKDSQLPIFDYGGGGWCTFTKSIINDNGLCCRFDCTATGIGGKYYYPDGIDITTWAGQVFTWSFEAKANRNIIFQAGHERGGVTTITVTPQWTTFSKTWTFTSSGNYTAFVMYPNTNISVGDWFEIRNIKIEKGSVATPWCPNPTDTLYTTLGYNNNIEYDCSGYSRNGTKSGNITWDIDSPRYTTSYPFNGIDNYITTNMGSGIISILNSNTHTIACWVKTPSSLTSTYLPYFVCRTPSGSSTDCQVFLAIKSGEIIHSYYSDDWSIPYSLANNTWYHIAFTSNNKQVICYVNGKNIASKTKGALNISSNGVPTVGADSDRGHRFKGNLSDFRIYATALSAEDIAELYHSAVIVDNTGKTYAYEYFEG